jgi:hypothetical protein
MKRYFFIIFLFVLTSASAQNTINSYKYVIVPERFGFQKAAGQYFLNSSTQQLLEQKGFTVYFDDSNLPNEIANNKCLALTADLQDKSGMLSTKLILTLKDCKGTTVFQSKVGTSREKDYGTGYNMALKDAFTSLDKIPYKYDGGNANAAQTPQNANATVAQTQPVAETQATSNSTPSNTSAAQATTNSAQPTTLYAQVIPNGFQLIDTTPKKVMTILKTSLTDHYIANNGTVSGVVFKQNNDWIFEYYAEGKLMSQKLSIKF